MVNNSTTPMLVKASTDVVGFQNMNQQILTVTYERWMQCQPVIQLINCAVKIPFHCQENSLGFFNTVILKGSTGRVLGHVTHCFYKKKVSSTWNTSLSCCCLGRGCTSHWWKPTKDSFEMDKWQNLLSDFRRENKSELHWFNIMVWG